MVRIALVISASLYIAAVAFELCSGGLGLRPLLSLGDAGLYRTVLKVILGTLSAATIFIANYFGKQSLPRKLSDHVKMDRFYSAMAAAMAENGQSEALLERLAREELIENGNWLSYQRDNSPDISL